MADLGIGEIALIVGALSAAGGGAASGVQASNAHDQAVQQRHDEQQQLYNQQKAASDQNAQTQAKQAGVIALARQRALSAAAGGTWGGTLGTGAGAAGAQGQFSGGYKTALGA